MLTTFFTLRRKPLAAQSGHAHPEALTQRQSQQDHRPPASLSPAARDSRMMRAPRCARACRRFDRPHKPRASTGGFAMKSVTTCGSVPGSLPYRLGRRGCGSVRTPGTLWHVCRPGWDQTNGTRPAAPAWKPEVDCASVRAFILQLFLRQRCIHCRGFNSFSGNTIERSYVWRLHRIPSSRSQSQPWTNRRYRQRNREALLPSRRSTVSNYR